MVERMMHGDTERCLRGSLSPPVENIDFSPGVSSIFAWALAIDIGVGCEH